MKINTAIFDLDGTLIDSMHIWKDISSNYIESLGLKPEPGLNEKMKSYNLTRCSIYFSEHYNIDKTPEEILLDLRNFVSPFYHSKGTIKAGVLEYLKLLKQNDVKIALATACSKDLAIASLKANEIYEYFDLILTCDCVKSRKDQPTIYLEVLKRLNQDISTAWVFEDTHHACFTAKSAGFNLIAIEDAYSNNKKELIKNTADIYIKTFYDLLTEEIEG